ncbi:MAG: antibiotic biosynthesis monooxygenase [Pseudomonadota bacterium]
MFIAMNRFQVALNAQEAFEQRWRERESLLAQMDGFEGFRLLKGREYEDYRLYATHTQWRDERSFAAWTGSEQFRLAHNRARLPEGTLLGHPQFEGFTSILEEHVAA